MTLGIPSISNTVEQARNEKCKELNTAIWRHPRPDKLGWEKVGMPHTTAPQSTQQPQTVLNVPEYTKRKEKNLDDVQLDVERTIHFTENIKYLQITTTFCDLGDIRIPPEGYELVPGMGWYRLHLTPLTWEEARFACEAEGAHLAVLNSPQEAAALKRISDRAPSTISGATWNGALFVGYSDKTEGKYITIFGETLEQAGYAQWHTSQPDNTSGAGDSDSDCGAVERNTHKFNDLPCSAKLAYYCEYEQ